MELLILRQGDDELRPLVFLALYTYFSTMCVDNLQHIVQADTKATAGFLRVLLVLGGTLIAIEDILEFAFCDADTFVIYLK